MSIAVLMTLCRREPNLFDVISGYANQSYSDFSIHIVDNDGNNASIVNEFTQSNIEYQKTSGHMCSLRNIALKRIKTGRILLASADCIPHKNHILTHNQYRDKPLLVLGLKLEKGKPDRRMRYGNEFASMVKKSSNINFCCDSNMSFPTHESKVIGGFWEKIRDSSGVREFSYRMEKMGCKIILDVYSIVNHISNDIFGDHEKEWLERSLRLPRIVRNI